MGTPKRSNRRGQALTEFVLVMPVLLATAILAIDMANMVYIAHRMAAATREGARIASETSLPTPENPGAGDTCDLAGCVNDPTICCLALNRSNLVLWNSGIQTADLNATWFNEVEGNTRYVMLRVEAENTVNFFFGIGTQTIRAASVAYGDEFPIT